MLYTKKHAFTLVELIIVITILAILATIAFVSFQSYTKDSRNTSRISTLKNIETGLNTFFAKTSYYPEPDNKVPVYASGNIIGYQGNIGSSVSLVTRLSNKSQDPLDGTLYTYCSNVLKNKYQLLSLQEVQTAYLSNQAYAANNILRTPKVIGDALGIILDINQTPIEQIGTGVDIVKTNTTYKIYLTDTISLIGTGGQLADAVTQEERDVYMKNFDFSNNFAFKKVLIIYPNTDTPVMKNKYQSLGFNVIVDSGATTLDKVNAYSPDIVVCDQYVWSCSYGFLNTLYNAGYKIVSQGNDTTNSALPITTYTGTSATLGTIYPDNLSHFGARGWQNISDAGGDPSRQIIESIHPNAISLGKDNIYNKTEIVYLEEKGKGKWLHFQTPITPPDSFFKRINSWILR